MEVQPQAPPTPGASVRRPPGIRTLHSMTIAQALQSLRILVYSESVSHSGKVFVLLKCIWYVARPPA